MDRTASAHVRRSKSQGKNHGFGLTPLSVLANADLGGYAPVNFEMPTASGLLDRQTTIEKRRELATAAAAAAVATTWAMRI